MMPGTVNISDVGNHVLYANSGGPRSRARSELISATILGKDDGYIRCPRIIRLGLTFPPETDPVEILHALLREEGYTAADELRSVFDVPQDRLICVPLMNPAHRVNVEVAASRQVLEQALLLGLCTNQIFDASRPVLWTQTSITRGLELFDPAGFYA